MRSKLTVFGLFVALVLQGCQYTIFGEPTVDYRTPTTIGVSYVPLKLGLSKESKAMAIISGHCVDRYEVTGRTLVGNYIRTVTIDAVCLE
jgi:hypothetical protein